MLEIICEIPILFLISRFGSPNVHSWGGHAWTGALLDSNSLLLAVEVKEAAPRLSQRRQPLPLGSD